MACRKAFPWFGCGDCCTHRLVTDTSAVEWSRNAGERAFCDVCHEVVYDAWHHDGVYYLLTATKNGTSVDSRNRVQAWDSDGERLWVSEFLNDEQATIGRICSDGVDVWVTVGGSTPFVYRLDALDGDVLYSSIEFTYAINYLCPDGTGKVWLAHQRQSDGDGAGFVSLWADDVISSRFGGEGSTGGATAHSIVASGSTLYVGHSYYQTLDFGDGYCEPCGFVSRYDDGEIVWISCSRIENLSPYADPPGVPNLVPLIAVMDGFVYFAFFDGSGYGKLETTYGKPEWIRELDRSIPLATAPCDGRREPIRDMDAAGGSFWIVVNRWLYQLDTSGNVLDSVTHDDTDIGFNACQYWQLYTVTANDDGGALMGGISAECDNPPNEEQDSSEVTCAECTLDFEFWCSAFDYCLTNDCGSVTTTARRRLGGCTMDQSPPCEGPLHIFYTCGETTVETNINMVAGGEDCDGSVTYEGSGNGITVTVVVECDGSVDVDVVISGCTVTVDSATLNCDGPLGYASVDFTFTGTCDGCDLEGCGVLFGEDCEIGVSTDCCGSVPESLPVSMSSAFCSYANGVTGTATWNASLSQWECILTVTTAAGDKTWGFAFECPAMGGSAQDFTIRPLDGMSMLSADCEPNATFQADMTSTCSPFEVTVPDVEFAPNGMGACCDDGTPMSPPAKATIVVG